MTGAGVPDVNGCAKGKEFWVELKEIHSGNKLTLRPMQISWLAKRASYGGQVFVMARKNDEIKLYHIDSLSGIQDLVKEGYSSDALVTLIYLIIGTLLLLLYFLNFATYNGKRTN